MFNFPYAPLRLKTKEILEGKFQSLVGQEDNCTSPI
jgi:hypothetical protein